MNSATRLGNPTTLKININANKGTIGGLTLQRGQKTDTLSLLASTILGSAGVGTLTITTNTIVKNNFNLTINNTYSINNMNPTSNMTTNTKALMIGGGLTI